MHRAAIAVHTVVLLSSGPGWSHTGVQSSVALHWSFDPLVTALLALSAALYAAGTMRIWASAGYGHGIGPRHAAAFALGWLILAAALVSPLDDFGSRSLWGHMVQHELLMLLAAPLLVCSRPGQAWLWSLPPTWRRALGTAVHWSRVGSAWRRLCAPTPAWVLHAGVIWIWHAPAAFQAALLSEWIHMLQHASFLPGALVFWSSVMRCMGRESGHGAAAASLFTTMLHTGALGALLTFSARVWYPAYAEGEGGLAAALDDQHLAGLIMWIPGGFVYMAAALAIAGHALTQPMRRGAAPRA